MVNRRLRQQGSSDLLGATGPAPQGFFQLLEVLHCRRRRAVKSQENQQQREAASGQKIEMYW